MNVGLEYWLGKRALAGDRHAFDQLIAAHRTELRNVAANFATWDSELDDLEQIMLTAVWRALPGWDPHRGDFIAYASLKGRTGLVRDWNRRRNRIRHDGQATLPIDHVGPDIPSWHYGADPLRVVLARDDLRRAWAILTEPERVALAEQFLNGGSASHLVRNRARRARERALPQLEAADGVHPDQRHCQWCEEPLPLTARSDALYHPTCQSRARNQRRALAEMAAA